MENQQGEMDVNQLYAAKNKAGNKMLFAIAFWLLMTLVTLMTPPMVTSNFLAGSAVSACNQYKVDGKLPAGVLGNNTAFVTYRNATPQQVDDFCSNAIGAAKSSGGFVGWFFSIPLTILLGLSVYPALTVLPANEAYKKACKAVVDMESELGIGPKTPEQITATELKEFDTRLNTVKEEVD